MGLPVVQHYSDVLCIWAYVAQMRFEEATRKFDDKVDFAMHFVPVFPAPSASWRRAGPAAARSTPMAITSKRSPRGFPM